MGKYLRYNFYESVLVVKSYSEKFVYKFIPSLIYIISCLFLSFSGMSVVRLVSSLKNIRDRYHIWIGKNIVKDIFTVINIFWGLYYSSLKIRKSQLHTVSIVSLSKSSDNNLLCNSTDQTDLSYPIWLGLQLGQAFRHDNW